MKTFYKTLAALLALGVLVPSLAFAQGATVGVSATVMTTAKNRANQEIDRRVSALNDLSARINAMQLVTDSFKASLSSNVQNEITAFTTLKTKIAADTDEATLKTDVKTIIDSYRIYILVLPQSRIAAAADRAVTIATMMSTLGAKLQARLQQGQQNGNDVTALAQALADLSVKINDAQTQAQAAVSATATLQPDNGDKTIIASNAAALKTGRADITAAQKDLAAARKDIETIVKGMKSFKAAAAASSTTSQ